MRISVIIPYLNAADTLGETLGALVGQRWPTEWEVIIADNGSTDDLGSVLKPFTSRIPSLNVVDASAKRGAAYARNLAVHQARGDKILFCDADDVPGAGWAAALAESLHHHDFVAARFEFDRLNPPSIAATRRGTQADALQTCRFLPFPFAGAGSLGILKRMHAEVGGFDERMSVCEDTDYCMRLQFAGRKLVFVPDALLHYRLRTTQSQMYLQGVRYAESNVFLYKKYSPRSSWELWRWRAYSHSLRALLGRTPDLTRTQEGKALLAWRLGIHTGAFMGAVKFGAPPVMA
ncbi:MAG: glycosyltransferase [Nitrospira sp.]|nr:glycosyltransferase [Nitrospira sp.]